MESPWTAIEKEHNDIYNHYIRPYNLYLSETAGDVNRDRIVDISDIVAVINTIAGDRKYAGRADVNTDAKTDISDIVAIINIIANGSGLPFTPR